MAKLPPILVYSLSATNGTRLSKTKNQTYPLVKLFRSTEHKVSSPRELYDVVSSTADQGDCLIKGVLTRELVDESRAGSTTPGLQTNWLVFDLDGAKYDSPEDFIADLPSQFHNVSYTVQFSASQNLKPGLRCHIFFLLKEPVYPVVLKSWFKYLNFTTERLRETLFLTSTNLSLLWPLDITVGQNDKIIYVSPPADRNDDKIPDPWITFVQKRSARVNFATVKFDANQVQDLERKTINNLRRESGLTPRRSYATKKVGSVEVLSNPGICNVTGHKVEREFNYLNLNGGDSWGYFHPVGQNEILYNFKGEPPYLIRELLPDYYASLAGGNSGSSGTKLPAGGSQGGSPDLPGTGVRYLAFCDVKTDTYYRGFFDESDDYLEIAKTSNLTKLHHFLKQHGQPLPDFVPEWDLVYDFQSDEIINDDERWINLYQKSDFIRNATSRTDCPSLAHKLLQHIVNYDQACYEHFVNWLAYIIQLRKQTGTAWVLHGTQGTGKGILFNKLLLPILSKEFVFRTKLDAFEAEFNSFMEHSLVILVDETQISDLNKSSRAMANLKQYITDSTVSIRRMRTDPYIVTNPANFIFASNTHDPIRVDRSDRRFNVAPRQEVPLLNAMSPEDIDKMCQDDSVQAFADFLLSYRVDVKAAQSVIDTHERRRLQSLTQDAAEEVVHALKSGDVAFFVDNAPDSEDPETLKLKLRLRDVRSYREIVDDMFNAQHPGTLSRTDLEVIFYYIVGTEYVTRHKFSKYIGHKGLEIQPVKIAGKSVRGAYIGIPIWDKDLKKEWVSRFKSKQTKKVRRVK